MSKRSILILLLLPGPDGPPILRGCPFQDCSPHPESEARFVSSSEEENGKTPALARFSVSLPEELLEAFDRWIQRQSLGTRSEALRKLIRRFISESLWEERSGEVCGTLTLLYDHHSRDAVGELTRLEHDFEDVIVCTTHIHLDHDHCLEAVLLKGPTCRARAFSEALMEKGLLYAAPSLTPLKESLWGRS